jgi:hypothetical protein
MNIRIQTYGKPSLSFQESQTLEHNKTDFSAIEGTALAALEKGFKDLIDLCDVVADEFQASRDAFNAKQVSP